MTMTVPAYLMLSRHHIWYFRWPLPASLHRHGKTRHIRLSLGTRDPKQALRLAKRLEYYAVDANAQMVEIPLGDWEEYIGNVEYEYDKLDTEARIQLYKHRLSIAEKKPLESPYANYLIDKNRQYTS